MLIHLRLPVSSAVREVRFFQKAETIFLIMCNLYDKSNHVGEEQYLIKDLLKISDNGKCNFPLIRHTLKEITFHDSYGCGQSTVLSSC